MSLSYNFEPTIEFAPCPPFFVENVYEIFISTAENNSLSAEITDEVWNKCTLLYPYPTSTTSTTTTTTTPTTTSTTEQTTTTPKQTTTSTTQQATTTQQQTTTSTTKQTTTTPKQTTTTATTKQTITSTPKKTTTTTPEKTAYSTTKLTTSSTIKTPTISTTKTESTTSTSIGSSTKETTNSSITLTASGQCDVVCLSLSLTFAVCILLGILLSLMYCNVLHRNRKHVLKHNRKINRKTTNGKYIPKFPRMSKQADLARSPIAFINPTFLTENGNIPELFDQYKAKYQPNPDIFPWNQTQSEPFPDYNQSHYDVFVSSEPTFHPNENQKNSYSNMNGYSRSAETNNKRVRHPSIGNHVPKMLPEYSEIYSYGVEIYDTSSRNSGLPKISIDSPEDNRRVDSGTRKHKLPRFPLENNATDSPYTYKGTRRSDVREVHMNENNDKRERDDGIVTHGLPRTPFDETEVKYDSTCLSDLRASQKNGTPKSKNENEETYTQSLKHGLPRTPFEQPEYGKREFSSPKQNRQPKDFAPREKEGVVNGNLRSNRFTLYQGRQDGDFDINITRSIFQPKNNDFDESSNTWLHHTKL